MTCIHADIVAIVFVVVPVLALVFLLGCAYGPDWRR